MQKGDLPTLGHLFICSYTDMLPTKGRSRRGLLLDRRGKTFRGDKTTPLHAPIRLLSLLSVYFFRLLTVDFETLARDAT